MAAEDSDCSLRVSVAPAATSVGSASLEAETVKLRELFWVPTTVPPPVLPHARVQYTGSNVRVGMNLDQRIAASMMRGSCVMHVGVDMGSVLGSSPGSPIFYGCVVIFVGERCGTWHRRTHGGRVGHRRPPNAGFV